MTTPPTSPRRESSPDEPPPILGAWRNVYFAVGGWLLFLILLFYIFAKGFTP